MNLAIGLHRAFNEQATPGRLFFWRGTGLGSWVNRVYQGSMREEGAVHHWDHVGVIGDAQGAYESTLFAGPSRNRSLTRYLNCEGELMIGEVFHHGERLSREEIDSGLGALIRAIQEVNDKRCGLLTYDWLSLVSFGWVQMNNRMICSELVTLYLNNALRFRRGWNLRADVLTLPDDLAQLVTPVWSSNS